MTRNTRFLTRTALLLALTLVFQFAGRQIAFALGLAAFQNFIVGPLVNLVLLVATVMAGFWGGAVVALLSPLGALLTGGLTEPLFLAIVGIGNLLLVAAFALGDRMGSGRKASATLALRILGLLAGTGLKTAWLWGGILLYVDRMGLPARQAGALVFAFSWPQAVTAAVGGVLALVLLPVLEKGFRKT